MRRLLILLKLSYLTRDEDEEDADPVDDEPHVMTALSTRMGPDTISIPFQRLCSFCRPLSQSAILQPCGRTSHSGQNDAYDLGFA